MRYGWKSPLRKYIAAVFLQQRRGRTIFFVDSAVASQFTKFLSLMKVIRRISARRHIFALIISVVVELSTDGAPSEAPCQQTLTVWVGEAHSCGDRERTSRLSVIPADGLYRSTAQDASSLLQVLQWGTEQKGGLQRTRLYDICLLSSITCCTAAIQPSSGACNCLLPDEIA